MNMSEPTKRTLEHIELIEHDLAPMFEVKLVVVVEGFGAEDDDSEVATAAGWLFNLLHLASEGFDIKTGAKEFLRSMISTGETRVHLCKIEQVEG
jgi:sugar phosphate isomerase/epimerase